MTAINDGFDQPHPVTAVQMAFPANVSDLMPAWDTIPPEFQHPNGKGDARPWIDFQAAWFYRGTSKNALVPRDDVDPDAAWDHLIVIQGSYEPSHEHKQAAVAWLASRWFKAVAR